MTHNTKEWEKEFDEVLETVDSPKNYYLKVKAFHHQQLQKAREEERERIEAVFKEHVPPHAMDLEDSVWLKRLLNKVFQHG